MDLSDLSTIRAVLSRHGFRFSKSLGQNFLIDPGVCPRMAELCGAGPETGVLEVGPGIGVLTAELAKRGAKVAAVELDESLLPVLSETLAEYPQVKIVTGDVLRLDLAALIREQFAGQEVVICANLPYYITSPAVMRFLEEGLPISAATVMVQKEAAVRFCAEPGSRACGAVSAAIRYYAEPKILFEVPRACFYPQPNVDSAVIRFDLLPRPGVEVQDREAFFATVKAAFGQRRKTVLNSVSAGLSMPKGQVSAALEAAGIEPTARAEQLTLPELGKLSDQLFLLRKEELT